MTLWTVLIRRRADVQPRWPGCRVIARRTAAGVIRTLIEADEAAIAAVRATPGVASVAVAEDGDELDDDGTVYEVSDGGQRWRVRRRG